MQSLEDKIESKLKQIDLMMPPKDSPLVQSALQQMNDLPLPSKQEEPSKPPTAKPAAKKKPDPEEEK